MRRLGHFGMRQHRALRREYGFLACREEAPSSVLRLRKRLRVPHELLSRGWTLCLVLLVTGSLCLVADAGRPERVISLWLSPRFTVMTVGAWALLASSVLAAFFSFVSNGAGARLPLFVVLAAAIAAVIAGVATAIYTGVLLTRFPRLSLLGHGLFRHSSVFRRCRAEWP